MQTPAVYGSLQVKNAKVLKHAKNNTPILLATSPHPPSPRPKRPPFPTSPPSPAILPPHPPTNMHRPSPRRPSPRLLTPKSLLTLLTFLCLSLSLYTFFTLHASPPSTLTAAEITSKNLRIYDKSKHTFSLQPYSKTTCIATLVSNDDEDIDDLRIALKSLNNLNLDSKTKIIIFYESDLTMSHTNKITKSLPSHHIDFEYINFQTFPEQFNPSVEDSNWHKRSKWGYHQMIRFWITRVWDFESVRENCDSLMRVDSDSCFLPSTKEEMGLEEGIVYR